MEQCAIRETFEESGLLLATSLSNSSRGLSDAQLDEARANIHAQKLNFKTFLGNHSLAADVKSLLPFTQWITPVNAPRYVPVVHVVHVIIILRPSGDSMPISSLPSSLTHPRPGFRREPSKNGYPSPVSYMSGICQRSSFLIFFRWRAGSHFGTVYTS